MIIDMTQTKMEHELSETKQPTWFGPICVPFDWIKPTNQEKEAIIAQLLSTKEGRQQLTNALVGKNDDN